MMCSVADIDNIITSSRYKTHVLHLYRYNITSIAIWKMRVIHYLGPCFLEIEETFVSSKGSFRLVRTGIFHYPQLDSSVVSILSSSRLSMHLGKAYESVLLQQLTADNRYKNTKTCQTLSQGQLKIITSLIY